MKIVCFVFVWAAPFPTISTENSIGYALHDIVPIHVIPQNTSQYGTIVQELVQWY